MDMYNIDNETLSQLHVCEVEQGYSVPCACAIGHDHTDQDSYYVDDE